MCLQAGIEKFVESELNVENAYALCPILHQPPNPFARV